MKSLNSRYIIEEEKVHIAENYSDSAKQLKEHAGKKGVSYRLESAIRDIINYHTREAVRNSDAIDRRKVAKYFNYI